MKMTNAAPEPARKRTGRVVVTLPPGEAGTLVLAGAYVVVMRQAMRRRRYETNSERVGISSR
jgi:hypothetical protein